MKTNDFVPSTRFEDLRNYSAKSFFKGTSKILPQKYFFQNEVMKEEKTMGLEKMTESKKDIGDWRNINKIRWDCRDVLECTQYEMYYSVLSLKTWAIEDWSKTAVRLL